ncbi:hypothetical protein [Vibrio pectenicida]|uniref:hypothetical protein n=1 Tax=Vibrio pectenicida TaxID=62763 RepID=UPI001FE5E710|nr:hypothetical protein [Vibrio pectenicida]
MITALLPFNAIANSCKIEGYTIGFFNGVATTETKAKLGLKKIKSTLDINQYNGESVEYQLFYNDSYIEDSGLNVLADVAESFDQRTYELEQKQFDRWEAFWDIVSGRQNSPIIKKISATFSWFKKFVKDSFSRTLNAQIREFLEALTLLVDAPDTNQTRMQHNLINDSHTWKGKKLIYIAHSQGNLWANESYKYVISQPGYGADNIRVIHIAPASPTLSPNSDYILSTSDMVINGLNFTGVGSVPLPNTEIAPSKSDRLGHGLIPIYLTKPKSIKKIQASVDNAFASISNTSDVPPNKVISRERRDSLESIRSEDGFPFFTGDYHSENKYPDTVIDPDFFKTAGGRSQNNFIPTAKGTGATMYRVSGDTHVGFLFDEPISFRQVARKNHVEISKHSMIGRDYRGGESVISVDLIVKDDVIPNTKIGTYLGLFKRPIFENKSIVHYNKNEKYDSETLALSLIIASNAHESDKYFRHHGMVCYTFSRDTVLIYNYLMNNKDCDVRKLSTPESAKEHLNHLKINAGISTVTDFV